MAIRSRTFSPRWRFPSTAICRRAESRSMPFVKTRHAKSCGMVTRDATAPSGRSNLLLVMPAFGQFARRIKPVQGSFFSCPTDVKRGGSKRIERFMKAGALFAGGLHHLGQNGWTKAPIDGHAFC